jgi:hypothetical protein
LYQFKDFSLAPSELRGTIYEIEREKTHGAGGL